MRISVIDAKGRLTERLQQAEAGADAVLTRHGHAAPRPGPVGPAPPPEARRTRLEAVRASGALNALTGPCAARSQDFLYGEDGLSE